MAAAMAAIQSKNIRIPTHKSTHFIDFHSKEDPYKDLTSNFPPEQDRILDIKLEKLMLDGCLPLVIHAVSSSPPFSFTVDFKTILIYLF